jgi:hypothetical protein
MPERYAVNLGEELKGKGDGNPMSARRHDDSAQTASEGGGGAPHRLAYALWRQGHGLLDICVRMRDRANPQSETVVMCVCISLS